jgi:hypothetical protein
MSSLFGQRNRRCVTPPNLYIENIIGRVIGEARPEKFLALLRFKARQTSRPTRPIVVGNYNLRSRKNGEAAGIICRFKIENFQPRHVLFLDGLAFR